MAYRYQVVSVGMWRGKIKRWNTTIHMAGSGSTASVKSRFDSSGWPAPGDVVGACSGGTASITVYASTGGAPISQTVYFDWQTPSTWIPYTGSYWAGVDPATPLDAAGESAIVIEGNMGALSATGKPVKTRKFLHAIPSRTAATYLDPDVSTATQAAFVAGWGTAYMLSPSGVAPVSVSALPWYGNHQRTRGRRRPVAALQRQAYSNGVITGTAGGAALAQQGAAPFPGE